MKNRDMSRRPTWELRNMIKALTMFELLNTAEENERLKAAKAELRARRSGKRG